MKASVEALGLDPGRLQIIIYQLVMVKRGTEAVRLSKRAGEIITLRDILDEVGPDACRFFFLQRSPNSQMDFDLELAARQSNENPVYYVQYAHARIAGILRHAAERGVTPQTLDVSLLSHPAELALIRKMLQLPELIEQAARALEPQSLPVYSMELATAFHAFYTECRVVTEDEALTGARLALVDAARIVLARTLSLMGVSAPDRM
jgi:arginyl-tRNA synthetase